MSWKNLNQQSLANGWLVEHEALQELDELNRLIDWDSVQSSLSVIHNKERGGKAWPPLLMFKILLLQVWYIPKRSEDGETTGTRFVISPFCRS